jgi:hypothetical protein
MKHVIPAHARITCDSGEPQLCYNRWRGRLASDEALLLVDFQLECHWLESTGPLALTAMYCVAGDTLNVAVTDRALAAEGLAPREQYLRWVAQHRLVNFDPSSPVSLQPEYIAKPWGREIWYTGVERRGVCNFACGDARTPIPWLQAALPTALAGASGQPLVLLKILDPSPLPVLGDLYFELHEKKREVYVVTHIDRGAWPDGVGYIRYGFDPQVVAHYATTGQFRAAYLESVLAYEALRRELDDFAERGLAPGPARLARETLLRERMERFTHLCPLRVGDVIQMPLLLPHALQHGVRVVEFQTPTYERKIVSFGQKVLTQDHWDSREAVEQMRLVAPAMAAPRSLHHSAGVGAEQLVDFPDFEVQRLTLRAGVGQRVEAGSNYALLMVVTGVLELGGERYGAEQALLLPRGWRGLLAAPEASAPLVLLLARPRS